MNRGSRVKKQRIIWIAVFVIGVMSVVVSIFLLLQKSQDTFNSLDAINNYAQEIDETPSPSNKDLLIPDYVAFYKQHNFGLWGNFLQRVGLAKKSAWSATLFKNLLKKVLQARAKKYANGDYVMKITPPVGAKFVLWGDIQGAFHSLTRGLVKIKELGIINDALEIIKPNHYIVFTGDVINRSPYILETLTLVLRLMDKNPDNVIYLNGNHEEADHFIYGLTRELQYKLHDSLFKKEILEFFNTLPLALYLSISAKNDDFVRISHYQAEENSLLQEARYGNFLKTQNQGMQQHRISLDISAGTKFGITLSAFIGSSARSGSELYGAPGLKVQQGSTANIMYNLLSSPTLVYRQLHEFFHDSFVVLSVGQNKDQWLLSHYCQDVRTKPGFVATQYDFFTGEKFLSLDGTKRMKTDLSKAGIQVAAGLDLSGSVKELGIALLHGMNACTARENKRGGVNGAPVTMREFDHSYRAHIALKHASDFVHNKNINIFLVPLGTETVKSYLPLIAEKKMLVLFPITSARLFQNKGLSNIILLQAFYENEAAALTEYAIKSLFLNKFAIFYQNDDFGRGPMVAAIKILKKHKIPRANWIAVSHQSNSTDVSKAVEEIQKFNPQVIIFSTVAMAALELCSKISSAWLSTKYLMAIQTVASKVLTDIMQRRGVNIMFASIMPPHKGKNVLPIMKEYLEEMQKIKIEPEVYSFHGYFAASILIDAMRKIKGAVTKESVCEQLTSLKDYNYKGFTLSYDAKTQELTKDIWIDPGNNQPLIHWIPSDYLDEDISAPEWDIKA